MPPARSSYNAAPVGTGRPGRRDRWSPEPAL